MNKKDLWFSLTQELYEKIKEYLQNPGLPATRSKFLMYLFYNYNPKNLKKEYSFSNATRKMVCIKVTENELNYINELAEKYNRSLSALARDYAYTFFKEKGII